MSLFAGAFNRVGEALVYSGAATIPGRARYVLANNTTPITLTLASPSDRQYYGQIITITKSSSDPETVTLATSGGSIVGNHNNILYMQYDSLTLFADGTNWITISASLRPHICHLFNSSPQSIPGDGSDNPIVFSSALIDDGGMADTGNNRVIIRRPGRYTISGYLAIPGLDTAEWVDCNLRMNGTNSQTKREYSPSDNNTVYSDPSIVLSRNAGDLITMTGGHNEGSPQNTFTGTSQRPKLMVTEIR